MEMLTSPFPFLSTGLNPLFPDTPLPTGQCSPRVNRTILGNPTLVPPFCTTLVCQEEGRLKDRLKGQPVWVGLRSLFPCIRNTLKHDEWESPVSLVRLSCPPLPCLGFSGLQRLVQQVEETLRESDSNEESFISMYYGWSLTTLSYFTLLCM